VAKKQVENGAQVGRANYFVLDEILVTLVEYLISRYGTNTREPGSLI
jgi:hypothetical protein